MNSIIGVVGLYIKRLFKGESVGSEMPAYYAPYYIKQLENRNDTALSAMKKLIYYKRAKKTAVDPLRMR